MGSSGVAYDMFDECRKGVRRYKSNHDVPYRYLGPNGTELYDGQVLAYDTPTQVMMRVFDSAGNYWQNSSDIVLPDTNGFGPVPIVFSGSLYSAGMPPDAVGDYGVVEESIYGYTIQIGERVVMRFNTPGVFPYINSDTYNNNGDIEIEEYEHGTLRVLAPDFLIDENDNGSTADENYQRQATYGVIAPVNHSGSEKDLRLLTIDSSLSLPKTNYAHITALSDWNGGLTHVTIVYSKNVRLYTKRDMSTLLTGTPYTPTTNMYTWDLTDDDIYDHLRRLRGSFILTALRTRLRIMARCDLFR